MYRNSHKRLEHDMNTTTRRNDARRIIERETKKYINAIGVNVHAKIIHAIAFRFSCTTTRATMIYNDACK